MSTKHMLAAAVAALALGHAAQAQNVQVFYDFGKDRNYITTTFEMFKADKFGDTFWFIDHYFNPFDKDASSKMPIENLGPANGSYFEIERGINFWGESALKDLSGHVEYDGLITGSGFNMGTWCFGLKYFFHSQDFSKTLTLYAMYERFANNGFSSADVPVKFSAVWGINDLFGLKGLTFKGFADFWGNDNAWGGSLADNTKWSFLTEPQLWMNLGSLFDSHLDIGGEVELSYNFVAKGFKCNPCAGIRWTF
jgi:hypothetical protein